MADIEVQGLAELNAQLDNFAQNVTKKIMRGALRAGQRVVQLDAKSRAPIEQPSDYAKKWGAYPGALRDSIKISARITRSGTVQANLRAGDSKSFYARWVEFGTKPHLIRASAGHSLFVGGKLVPVAHHPGARPFPFMRTAIDLKAGEATQAVAAYIRERVSAEMDKLADETDDPA